MWVCGNELYLQDIMHIKASMVIDSKGTDEAKGSWVCEHIVSPNRGMCPLGFAGNITNMLLPLLCLSSNI